MFEILAQNDLLFQAIAMLIVDIFHLLINVESQVNMRCECIFSLRDIHVLKLGDVLTEFIDCLSGVLIFYDVLNVSAFSAEGSL